ncbi:hypothetical protein BCR43DRAFT_147034 [Syncephalastrum racemosum]|uniref:Uncharacterized protein n=1 Tax=Syncephalastrum racemosum TaxID=13706 RepID=A0A1X2HNX8_SYNRA|nr:hypothetical protein BCR43DRAFT_147034 [Syncephalastrum racemosum]
MHRADDGTLLMYRMKKNWGRAQELADHQSMMCVKNLSFLECPREMLVINGVSVSQKQIAALTWPSTFFMLCVVHICVYTIYNKCYVYRHNLGV